ncbi:MAG TPA: hypothetical protein VFQ91_26285 [Bryobacteraceae bacterium]|nr:hypothetical protein [Bryobacteraceae bacterium]
MRLLKQSLFVLTTAAIAFGQQAGTVVSVSVGNYRPIVSPASIVSGWGTGLAANTVVANTNTSGPALQLPETLGNVRLTLVDSARAAQTPGLYMVSPGQVNYVLPDPTAQGLANLTLANGTSSLNGTVLVSNVAPAIFSADGSGNGVPAAQILRITAAGQAVYEMPFRTGASTYTPAPIRVSTQGESVYVLLYGTGFRRHSLNPVIATVGGVNVPVLYAGAQSQYPGMDQINVGPLPASLAGKGVTDLQVIVDGVPANTVTISIQ